MENNNNIDFESICSSTTNKSLNSNNTWTTNNIKTMSFDKANSLKDEYTVNSTNASNKVSSNNSVITYNSASVNLANIVNNLITSNNTTTNNDAINTSKNTNNVDIRELKSVSNKINIDVAVLCQEYTTIEKMCSDHIINLDEIAVTKEIFQTIFYPYHENFGMNKNNVINNKTLTPYISFLPENRTVDGKNFYLLEKIISNIENDLNVSRNCFTIESLVELSNEITNLHSLCDLNYCSVLSSLTWPNIVEIIKNYKLSDISDEPLIPICVISIIFKTPTVGVKNTIVRFNYRITNI
jgi:hypothetical protein